MKENQYFKEIWNRADVENDVAELNTLRDSLTKLTAQAENFRAQAQSAEEQHRTLAGRIRELLFSSSDAAKEITARALAAEKRAELERLASEIDEQLIPDLLKKIKDLERQIGGKVDRAAIKNRSELVEEAILRELDVVEASATEWSEAVTAVLAATGVRTHPLASAAVTVLVKHPARRFITNF